MKYDLLEKFKRALRDVFFEYGLQVAYDNNNEMLVIIPYDADDESDEEDDLDSADVPAITQTFLRRKEMALLKERLLDLEREEDKLERDTEEDEDDDDAIGSVTYSIIVRPGKPDTKGMAAYFTFFDKKTGTPHSTAKLKSAKRFYKRAQAEKVQLELMENKFWKNCKVETYEGD